MSAIGDIDEGGGERDDDVLAAELVLGLLTGEERASTQMRRLRDPAFARAAERWETHFAAFADTVPAVSPPARLWAAIEAGLASASAEARPLAAPVAAPAAASPPAAAAERPAGLWQSLAFWRGLSFVSLGAAAAASLALAVMVAQPAPEPMPLVAALMPDDGMGFMVTLHEGDGMLRALPVSLAPGETRVPELWMVPAEGNPHSLGLLDIGAPAEMPLDAELRAALHEGAVLAVSMEPAGGSPTGLPTGPVVASGHLTRP